ncbi:MAG: beta-galactosidase [Lentisphaeria bacterium]|nr:beta-galactosidase [Lentisphaeria bacterium]
MKNYGPVIRNAATILHGGDYNPDQWLETPEVIDRDFELMEKSGCNTFSVGIFSWTALEPAPGDYRFDWLDRIMDRMAGHGFHVILATPSGAKPAWLATAFPEICRVDDRGRREPYTARHNHCWSSPVYRSRVREINSKLAERYADHPALSAWHISNEYSGSCYCELCREHFRGWLRERYGTLDNLNRAWCNAFWSHIHTDWAEITPWGASEGNSIDWKRFSTFQCCDFMKFEVEALRLFTPDVPVTTNMMGFFDGLDYWRVAEVCDFISDDVYPPWGSEPDVRLITAECAMRHDMHRSMKDGKPFLIMESAPSATNWQPGHRLKRPNQHKLEELNAVGHGADGTLYFQWRKSRGNLEKFHGAVVDHVGTGETRVFRDVAELGALYRKCGGICGSAFPAGAAVIWDWENLWSFQTGCGPGGHEQKKYLETVQDHYRALWTRNIPLDVIESLSDFSKYRLLVCPMLMMLKPGVADRLKAFAAAGGTLVMTYLSGYVDRDTGCFSGGWPGDGLMELFGIWNEEIGGVASFDRQAIRYAGKEFEVIDYAERIHLRGAEALAEYTEDPLYRGLPAVTVNRFGEGRAYYVAARTREDFLAEFLGGIAVEAGLEPVVPAGNEGVSATLRSGEDGDYLFLFNYTAEERGVRLPEGSFTAVADGSAKSGVLTLPPFGSEILKK